MIDVYKVSWDLSLVKLDEIFYEFELYEQANFETKEKGIILVASKTRSKEKKKPMSKLGLKTNDEDEGNLNIEIANLVKKMRRRNKNFSKKI